MPIQEERVDLGLDGFFTVVSLPTENQGGSGSPGTVASTIGVSITFADDEPDLPSTFRYAGDAVFTVEIFVGTAVSAGAISVSVNPIDADVSIGAISGSGQFFSFDVTLSKVSLGEFLRTLVVTVTSGSITGRAAKAFVIDTVNTFISEGIDEALAFAYGQY